jgi:hypothetical protein
MMVTCDRRSGKQNAPSRAHDSVEESRRTRCLMWITARVNGDRDLEHDPEKWTRFSDQIMLD